MKSHVPPPSPKLPRAANIAAQAVLIMITIAIIVAIWLPAIVGPSEAKQQRDERARPRSVR
jgi:hypothetical protein